MSLPDNEDMLRMLEALMLQQLAQQKLRPGSAPVRFSSKRTWEQVDRDLDNVFLSMIGIQP